MITYGRGPALHVRALGNGRLRVGPFAEADARREHLKAWLDGRPNVLDVRSSAQAVAVDVRYREPRGLSGAFVAALRDHVATLPVRNEGRDRRDAANAEVLGVEVERTLPGRCRLRLRGIQPERVPALEAFVARSPGVTQVRGAAATLSLLVHFDPSRTTLATIVGAIEASAPEEWPAPVPAAEAPSEGAWKPVLYNTALFLATLAAGLPVPVSSAGVVVAAVPSLRRALTAMREGRLSVDLLDVAAIGTSLGTGQPATAAFMTWLLSIGDVVLAHTTGRARKAIEGLLRVDDPMVFVLRGDRVEEVPFEELVKGDLVLVEPGGRIPVDGTVRRGVATVDEKALTGESLPRVKEPGDTVLAATVVVEGELVIEVERTGCDTTAARIVQIVEGVGTKPVSLQREIERKADWLVLPTFAVASAAGAFAGSMERLTSVLITDFGTGVRIAIPTSILATMTRAAHDGVLVKGGHYLERLARADTIVFDKTGTLTRGEPRVVFIEPVGRLSENEVLALAAILEARKKHPVAEAIRRLASERGLPSDGSEAEEVAYTIGGGLVGRVAGQNVVLGSRRFVTAAGVTTGPAEAALRAYAERGISSVLLAVDGRLEGVLGYADEARPESKKVIAELRQGGRRRIVLLSGDARPHVDAIASDLGIDRAVAELLPDDKAEVVRELQREGRTVAMVGDGINDAPALALADVGVSLSGATDVALETADVVLLSGGLEKLPRAFALADAGMRAMHRCVGLVIVPNLAAMALGAVGLVPPPIAATINNGSTIVAALVGLGPLLAGRPS